MDIIAKVFLVGWVGYMLLQMRLVHSMVDAWRLNRKINRLYIKIYRDGMEGLREGVNIKNE